MFIQSPIETANLIEWELHLVYLLNKDQRDPFVAMATRRAQQHIKNRKYKDEFEKSKSST